jgi:hypothetical protein
VQDVETKVLAGEKEQVLLLVLQGDEEGEHV